MNCIFDLEIIFIDSNNINVYEYFVYRCISPIIDKRLYLTLFDLATTSWVITIT